MNQSLLQIHKEILELAQEQESCNAVLGMMLSTAECFSSRFGKVKNERIFSDYNIFGSGDSKNESSLKAQLRIQTKLFRNNYYYMKNKDGKYTFPKNFDSNKIIEIVKIWKDNVSHDKKIYYDNIISIIQDDKANIKYPHIKMDTISNNGLDPNIMVDVFLPIMNHVDERLQQVGEEANKKGIYDNTLKTNGKKYDDKGLEKNIQNNLNKRGQKENIDQLLYLGNYLQNCFTYGELYYVLLLNKKNYILKFYPNNAITIKQEDKYKIGETFKNYLINLINQFELIKKCKNINLDDINGFIRENGHFVYTWKAETNNELLTTFDENLTKIMNYMC